MYSTRFVISPVLISTYLLFLRFSSATFVDQRPSLRGASNELPTEKSEPIPGDEFKGPASTLQRYPYTDLFRPIFNDLASQLEKVGKHQRQVSFSVAVGIMSEGPWAGMRQIHRDSWMRSSCVSRNVYTGGVVPVFVVSGPADESLRQEMNHHGDILLLPKPETPRNKTFAWFQQAVERIPDATFYAKMDSDTFLNPCALLSDLASLRFKQSEALYYGRVIFNDEKVCGVPATATRMPSLCGQSRFPIEDSRPAVRNWEGRAFPSAVEGERLGHTAMHGCFYSISGNIARWVAKGGDDAVHLPISMKRTHGNGEDVIVADWVARFFEVHPLLRPRIKRRATEPEDVFRHASEMLTKAQTESIVNQFPTSSISGL